MEKISTDIYSFENLRKDGFVYVDKTDLLWRLAAKNDGRQFFISRPRRFGKSLMLSTLKCIFEGKRELFKGLKIDKMRYDWAKYPVVMLNMADVAASTVDKLNENLSDLVDGLVEDFELGNVRKVSDPGKRFGNFLKALAAAKGEYVVLVDEYDVPLQGFFGDRKSLVAVREMMHDFYVQLKNNEANIRFLMLTGVTKLTKVSVFSGLNHQIEIEETENEEIACLGPGGRGVRGIGRELERGRAAHQRSAGVRRDAEPRLPLRLPRVRFARRTGVFSRPRQAAVRRHA